MALKSTTRRGDPASPGSRCTSRRTGGARGGDRHGYRRQSPGKSVRLLEADDPKPCAIRWVCSTASGTAGGRAGIAWSPARGRFQRQAVRHGAAGLALELPTTGSGSWHRRRPAAAPRSSPRHCVRYRRAIATGDSRDVVQPATRRRNRVVLEEAAIHRPPPITRRRRCRTHPGDSADLLRRRAGGEQQS